MFVSSHYDGVTCISQRVWINCEIGIQSNGAVTKHEPCEGPRTGLPVRLGSIKQCSLTAFLWVWIVDISKLLCYTLYI